jgi:hypothetical protein
VDLGGPRGRGITFEAPRHSLLTAVRYEIFDDLLIGNFVKTDEYFQSYHEKSSFQEWLEHMRVKSNRKVRRAVLATLPDTPVLYRTARSAYRRFIA